MVNTLQLIILLPLFDIKLPANAGVFFRQLMKIVAFDYLEIGDWINEALDLEPTEAVNSNYDAVGLESLYFINNMGSLFLMFMMYPCVVLIELLLRKLQKVC